MIYIAIMLLLLIDIVLFLYHYHAHKAEKSCHYLHSEMLQKHARELSELKLDLHQIKFREKSAEHDLNGYINTGKDNHREISKLKELQQNISARLNGLITLYQDLQREVNLLKK